MMLQKRIKENGIAYELHGDYYYPLIKLEESPKRRLGKFGLMRKWYLEDFNKILYHELVLSGMLFKHLYEIEDAAKEREAVIMEELLDEELLWNKNVPDKKTDQMGWVQYMNGLKHQAEEIVIQELVFS